MRISCLVFTRTSGTSDCFKNTIQYNIYIYILMIFISGWWFGTWLLWCSIELGMSSSQVTVSHIFLVWDPRLGIVMICLGMELQQCPNQPLKEDSTNPITLAVVCYFMFWMGDSISEHWGIMKRSWRWHSGIWRDTHPKKGFATNNRWSTFALKKRGNIGGWLAWSPLGVGWITTSAGK